MTAITPDDVFERAHVLLETANQQKRTVGASLGGRPLSPQAGAPTVGRPYSNNPSQS
jgi:hypothetical protein